MQNQTDVQLAGVHMMANNKQIKSNLKIIKSLCDDLEEFFECFTLDRVWNEKEDTLTVCFTAEKVKEQMN